MAYVPNYGGDWKNYPDVTTPITEAALDNLETQYAEAKADIDARTLKLTPVIFRVIPGYGTCTSPELINDNDVATNAVAQNINEYAIIEFTSVCLITQFRHYGESGVTDVLNLFKIQYKDVDNVFHDWVINIAQRVTDDWSNWDSSGGEVLAAGIKVIFTFKNAANFLRLGELEVKY